MTKILVLGRSGQVARALVATPVPARTELVSLGRTDFDLARTGAIADALDALRPDAIINAAAYTQVDRAESEEAAAFALNRDAPAALARWCAAHDAPLVHISTDYVFDGEKLAPYRETDPKAPLSVYGRSKADGEHAILTAQARSAILRTSWVFAANHANFVTAMLRLASTQAAIDVVSDQIGNPTSAADLAEACLHAAIRLLDQDGAAEGLWHFANAGAVSRAEFAQAILRSAKREGTIVRPILTRDRPTPAKRPLNSRLDLSKFSAAYGAPPPWQDALARMLAMQTA